MWRYAMTADESYRCSTRRMSRIRGSRRVICKVHMIYVQPGADGLVRDHVLRVEARCRSGGVGPLCILGWLAEGLKAMACQDAVPDWCQGSNPSVSASPGMRYGPVEVLLPVSPPHMVWLTFDCEDRSCSRYVRPQDARISWSMGADASPAGGRPIGDEGRRAIPTPLRGIADAVISCSREIRIASARETAGDITGCAERRARSTIIGRMKDAN